MSTHPTLLELREAAGITPKEAAFQCHVTTTTWYNWERRKDPPFVVYVGIRTILSALSPKRRPPTAPTTLS